MQPTLDDTIRSPDNHVLNLLRTLRRRNVREAERLFVVEGRRHVEGALAAGGTARWILVREGALWQSSASDAGTSIRVVAGPLFDRMSGSVSPQPVIGMFEFPDVPVRNQPDPLALVVDGAQDPGNLGTMLRSAAAADVAVVLLTNGTVDPYNDKVVRAAMGAHFQIAIRWLDVGQRAWLLRACPTRVVADSAGATDHSVQEWCGGVAIIIGGEARGVSTDLQNIATSSVRIPMASAVESLNAGVAASILLFEARRQRSLPPA